MPNSNPNSKYDEDDLENEQYAQCSLSKDEILELAAAQKSSFLIIYQLQIMVVCAFLMAFIGFVLGTNVINTTQEILSAPSKYPDFQNSFYELEQKLHSYGGPLYSFGSLGCAIWFFASSICGSLSFIVPVFIYNKIAKSHLQQKSAFVVLYDLIKAVVLKYTVMILCLGFIFKYTSLFGLAVMLAFVTAICLGTFIVFVKSIKTKPVPLSAKANNNQSNIKEKTAQAQNNQASNK